ncbi:MAG: DUF1801 domain-containing protein [Rhizobiaceae bacterium]
MANDLGNLEGFDSAYQAQLAPLRRLILDVAVQTSGVGALEESLKWGEPSYAPARKGIGSSVRLAPRKDGKVSMHFICHTGLVSRFRELYPEKLTFEGNRTIVLDPQSPAPQQELRHCIALALTYHKTK